MKNQTIKLFVLGCTALFLAFGTTREAFSQPPISDHSDATQLKYLGAPEAFLGGKQGSHYLNGQTGSNHYIFHTESLGWIQWGFDLEFDKEDSQWYYYHEKGFPDYRWRFRRRYDPNGYVLIQTWFEEQNQSDWTFFDWGYITLLTKNSKGTSKMRSQK